MMSSLKTLKKLCEEIAGVVSETITTKYYFVKISQSKKGHIYLTVWKKRGRHLGEKQRCFHRKINEIQRTVFQWFCE